MAALLDGLAAARGQGMGIEATAAHLFRRLVPLLPPAATEISVAAMLDRISRDLATVREAMAPPAILALPPTLSVQEFKRQWDAAGEGGPVKVQVLPPGAVGPFPLPPNVVPPAPLPAFLYPAKLGVPFCGPEGQGGADA